MTIFVLAADGTKLMPTTNIKKVRKMLKSGEARIAGHEPFTIQLLRESGKATQPIELTEDTGYETMGLSVKSEAHEYISEEDTFLKNEKQKHASRRKERRNRRNRLRYRKPRFDNRVSKKKKGWLAPSVRNKKDQHIARAERILRVCPVTSIKLELGQFDTQVLAAVDKGKPVPQGLDYQHGPRYGFDTLREVVFYRDGYKCTCCKKSGIGTKTKPGVILRVHHLGYRKGDRSDRLDNLATVCTECHTPANHQEGGLLYNLKPKLKTLRAAAFMNTIRWYLYGEMKERHPDIEVRITYGAVTKRERLRRHMEKSHANDAYCIGTFHPKHRTPTQYYEKARRHNRELSKFHDAKWVDKRDGTVKKGAQLPNGRTNRNHKKDTKNLHKYRLRRVEKGHLTMQMKRHKYRPGDVVVYKGKLFAVKGMQGGGTKVDIIRRGEEHSPSTRNTKLRHKTNGWKHLL